MAATGTTMSGALAGVSTARGRGPWSVRRVILFAVLILLALIFEFPIYWTISSSLKAPYEILNYPPLLYPAVPQWENYARVFTKEPFALWIGNTVFVVGLATLGAVLSSSLVAY